MQNSLSVPPKNQGDVSMVTSPGEKQLTQKMLEPPGKTVCAGDSNVPSGMLPSGQGLQSMSQFRSIAPKLAPRLLAPRVLPGPSQQANPGPSLSAKAPGVPPQSYALMQVAGQEGTFSLVALPHVTSAQPVQKPRLPLPENLKLPIPRYQPPRHSKGPRRTPGPSTFQGSCSKLPAQTQAPPSPSEHPEPLKKPSPPKRAPAPDPALAGMGPATLTSGGGRGDPGSAGTSNHGGGHPPATPASPMPEEQGLPKCSGKANTADRRAGRRAAATASEKRKEKVNLAKAGTHLSPGVWGHAAQVITSFPGGKLPILPYSRVKTLEPCGSEAAVHAADFPGPGLRADSGKTSSSVTEGFCVAPQVASKVPASQRSRQSPCDSAFPPATKADLNHKPKVNGGAKRRGRKRKVPDDLSTFQGKRRKCVITKGKEGKERVKTDPQEARGQKPGAVKRYRSIMPKPVLVLPALAPLVPPVTPFQSPLPGQSMWLSNSLSPKDPGRKQDSSPSAKPTSASRTGFSGIWKPWHRCHVCDRHFQYKQHLREHMNTHTNRRPYSCRLCRKAYVRAGSLSAHMQLQHGSEGRPRRLMCCEFCAKVFGHVRVYFGHLKEVHRVLISTEPGPCEQSREHPTRGLEDPGPSAGTRGAGTRECLALRTGETKPSLEEDLLLNQADEVKFQIRCGRCQITAQSFAEIKFHLLYVHGEEIQGRLQEEISPGSKGAQGERVRHAASFWKQHPERRKMLKPCPSEGELHSLPRLKKQSYLHHEGDVEIHTKQEGPGEPGGDPQGRGPHAALPESQLGFNCVLCAQTLGGKEDLLLHWEHHHKCEDPPKLWTILGALSHQGGFELPGETRK
uniref:Zinc finger protein 438 n=2 Tax=Sus scrofa TaxID=9823 RepID=A0A8D1DX29_PIG